MNTLTTELQEIILSYLPDVDMRTVVKYMLMGKISKSIYKKDTFWKRKLENKLGFSLDIAPRNPRNIYYCIGEDLHKSFVDACEKDYRDVVKIL